MFCCDWLVFNRCDWRISILVVLVNRSLGGPLSYGSPVVVFLDRGHPCFWNFYFTVPVDVVRVKCSVNRLFDPNKLYFDPTRVVSGVVGEHIGCLGHAPYFCLALVFQSRRCKLYRIHREFFKPRRPV